jgi:hypothetical protein
MIALLFAVAPALALPTAEVALIETSTTVDDLAVGWDEAWLSFTTSGGELVLVDTSTWDAWNVAASGSVVGGVAIGGPSGASTLFAGLADGRVAAWGLLAGEAPTALESFNVGGSPLALVADSQTLYALVDTEDQGPVLESYLVSSRTATGTAPADLGSDGFSDMGARMSTDPDSGSVAITYVYVTHGGSRVSRIAVSSGAMSPTLNDTSGGSQDYDDLWTVDDLSTTWFVNSGSASSISSVSSDTATFEIVNPSSPALGDPTAVGGSYRDGWLGVSNAAGLQVFAYSSDGLGTEPEVVLAEGALATEIVSFNGYGVLGRADGAAIVSDLPWVEIEAISAETVLPEEEFTVDFTSSKGGSWQAYYQVQGAGAGPEKFSDASGTLEAGESVTATLSLPASDNDADQRFLVELRVSADGGATQGRDGIYVSADPRPSSPDLNGAVGFGDRTVQVRFKAFDLDVAQSYQMWITTEPWEASDYASAGPAYVGPDAFAADRVFQGEPDVLGYFDCTLGGLTNGVTYYVGVRAIDADGATIQESAMSDVYAVTPEETFSVSERLGIESWCGLPLQSAGWFGALAGFAAISRRSSRRRVARASTWGALLFLGLALPGTAEARPHEDDATPRHWNVALRYGPFLSQSSETLTDAFGDSDNRLLRADLGWTSNLLDVDFGFGLYSDDGGQTTASGEASVDETTLTAVPLGADVTLRLDFLREQPVVPFARAGLDLWLWNETWVSKYDAGGGGNTTAGSFGWHWAAGLMLLLDGLDPGAASKLENSVGVNDTYLVGEYRQSSMLDADALDFGSSELTVGLQFDF